MRLRLHHILLTAFLGFSLLVASVVSGLAAGDMAARDRGAITMVICAGHGPVTVTISASGQPVEPSDASDCWNCPVCAFQAAAFMGGLQPWARPAEPANLLSPTTLTIQLADAVSVWRPARGPPSQA